MEEMHGSTFPTRLATLLQEGEVVHVSAFALSVALYVYRSCPMSLVRVSNRSCSE